MQIGDRVRLCRSGVHEFEVLELLDGGLAVTVQAVVEAPGTYPFRVLSSSVADAGTSQGP